MTIELFAPAARERSTNPAQNPHDALLDRLARRAQLGDTRAAAHLCAQIAPLLQRYLTRACREAGDVEDACQQVLLRVFEALPRYRASATPIRHWVMAIAANHLRDRARTSKDVAVTAPDKLCGEVERRQPAAATDTAGEQRDSFRELIAPLKPDQQRVLVLLYDYDLTPEQAALVLGRTAASVRQLHKRALDALRRLVAQVADEQALRPR